MKSRHVSVSLATGLALAGFITPTATFAAPTTYQSAVLADNPYVYYQLGEDSGTTAADSSGNTLSGTYVGSPSLGAAGAGVVTRRQHFRHPAASM